MGGASSAFAIPRSAALTLTSVSSATAASGPPKDAYQGIVKRSKGAFGWVVCPALQSKFPDDDVFLHKNKCVDNVMPWQGERVSFTLMCDEMGRPQAAQAWRC